MFYILLRSFIIIKVFILFYFNVIKNLTIYNSFSILFGIINYLKYIINF